METFINKLVKKDISKILPKKIMKAKKNFFKYFRILINQPKFYFVKVSNLILICKKNIFFLYI